MKHINVAIDGPGGAGKSTISKAVAKRLGIIYVDTGALYRTIGYYAREHGLSVEEAKISEKITPMLEHINIEIAYVDGAQHVILNGEDLGDKIRQPDISMYASACSSVGTVRAFLLEAQKKLARENSVIMDGRDIGTVILPDADVKIFLTASCETRARRRVAELAEKGMPAAYDVVLADIIKRDEQDRSRDVAPAIAAPDALHFDNSYDGFEEALNALLELIRKGLSEKGKEI